MESVPKGKTTRCERGARLYRERKHDIERIRANVYRVPSCTGEHAYTVMLDDGDGFTFCDCPDYRRAKALGETCKHYFAAEMQREYHRSAARRRKAGLKV